MKKTLLLAIMALGIKTAESQCVYTCSNYVVSPTTFSNFPSGTTDITPSFTNPVLGTFADDGDTGPIPIGFSFDFFCNTYTDVWVCSNGFLQFTPIVWPTQYVHPTQQLPDGTDPNNMIAFNMTDLDPGVAGTITYTTVGVAPNRMFILTYSNVPGYGQNDQNTGQIVLRETSNIIEIHTTSAKPCSNQSLGSTQGIENINGTIAFTPPNRNANSSWGSTANNTAFIFSPYTASPLGAITGNTILCEGTSGNYLISSSPGALTYSWSAPAGWTGGGTTTAISYTAGATPGAISVTAQYTCGSSPASTLEVTVLPAPVVSITSATPGIICSGQTVQVNVSGASVYTLEPGTVIGSGPFVTMPMTTTDYTVRGTDQAGCDALNMASASIQVLESPTVSVNSGTVCQGKSFTMKPTGANQYSYSTLFATVTNTVVGIHTYSVIGTATNGCKSSAISTLEVNALPSTTVTADRPTMCRNESVTLTAQGASSYAWSSTVSTSPELILTPQFSAVHTVTGTSAEGCVKTSTIFIQVSPCSGIEEFGNGAAFLIYPNPSSGEFTVESVQSETAVIYDLLGRDVQHVKLQHGTNSVNCDLPAGKYFMKGEKSGTHHSFVITKH